MIIEVRKKVLSNLKTISAQKSGIILMVSSLGIGIIIFYPMLIKEILYRINKPDLTIEVLSNRDIENYDDLNNLLNKVQEGKVLTPIDEDFGIVVPKLGINSKVISEVNPNDSKEYQIALSQGIAHAKGTNYPKESGNTFIFAHSSDNFYNANRYNSVFYLLHHLEAGDSFYIFYEGEKYLYEVTDKKVVEPTEIQYMEKYSEIEKAVTLMTCWPPGTTSKRLIIIGKQI